MSYYKGDKVNILDGYPDGTVGTIIDRVSDFVWNVGITDRCGSWEEEFHTDELSPHESWREKIERLRKGQELLRRYDPEYEDDHNYGEGQIG